MADAREQLQRYIRAFREGEEADPAAFVAQTDPAQRAELAALIEAFLQRAPMDRWDREAFAASGLAPFAERVTAAMFAPAGCWPAVLPALRERAQLKRSELVGRLADALNVANRREKVGVYYHQMETGALAPDGVSDRVLEALGSIVGQSAGALRAAGESLGGAGTEAASAPVFARRASDAPPEPAAAAPVPATEEWDEVDRMFRGGVSD